eukprot:1100097-Amphidinium_carterae.1
MHLMTHPHQLSTESLPKTSLCVAIDFEQLLARPEHQMLRNFLICTDHDGKYFAEFQQKAQAACV